MGKYTQERPIILIIDDRKEDFLDKIKKYLSRPDLELSTDEIFIEKYQIKCERVTKTNYKRRAENITKTYLSDRLFVVLIDMVLVKNGDDDSGMKLAKILAEKWPTVPILIYTVYGETKAETLAFASVKFDGAFDGHMLPDQDHGLRLPIDDFERLLIAANRKKKMAMESMRLYLSRWSASISIDIAWDKKYKVKISHIQSEVIELLTKLRFKDQNVKSLRLEPLSPGFSGAYLFKVTGKDIRTQVLKINENPKKLEDEIKGYNHIESKSNVPSKRLPLVLLPRTVTKLADDWWGVISLGHEKGHETLLEAFSQWKKDKIEFFFNQLWGEGGLKKIYRVEKFKETDIGKIVGKEELKRVLDVFDELHRYVDVASQRIPSIVDNFKQLKEIMNKLNERPKPIEVAESRFIHGDLNCRNILIDPNDISNWLLIDFPHTASGNLAKDFAKAEIEILGIIMDWASGKDIDLDRLPAWLSLIHSLSQQLDIDHKTPCEDKEIERVASAIAITREKYRDSREKITGIQSDYFTHLAAQALRSVQYRDLAIPKRLLLALYSLDLLKKISG